MIGLPDWISNTARWALTPLTTAEARFLLAYGKHVLLALGASILLGLADLPLQPANYLLCCLIAIQMWADLHDHEPITMAAYARFKAITGMDPRQLDQLIERRIAPLCEALNGLPRTETLYSCEGHLRPYCHRLLPQFRINGPYVMFRSECDGLMQELSDHLFAGTLTNH